VRANTITPTHTHTVYTGTLANGFLKKSTPKANIVIEISVKNRQRIVHDSTNSARCVSSTASGASWQSVEGTKPGG
jgi:hypothetical protein